MIQTSELLSAKAQYNVVSTAKGLIENLVLTAKGLIAPKYWKMCS